jgi:hypothetical protein
MRGTPLIAGLGALVLVAGCGGSHAIRADALSSLVLRPADLGARYESFSSGPQVLLDTQGTPRANPDRYGRKGGWIARYRRIGSGPAAGALVVESRADLFGDAGGATTDLRAYREQLERTPGSHLRPLELPAIGAAAVGVTFVQAGAKPVRFFTIAWRDRNATASVTVEGFAGEVSRSDAISLARKQEARIAAK